MLLESAEYRDLLRKYQETKNYVLFLELLDATERLIYWVAWENFDLNLREYYMVTDRDVITFAKTSFFNIINRKPESEIVNIPRFLAVALRWDVMKAITNFNSKHVSRTFSYFEPIGGKEENTNMLNFLSSDEDILGALDKWEVEQQFEEIFETIEKKYREPLRFRMHNYNTSEGAKFFKVSENEFVELARNGRKILGQKLELAKGSKVVTKAKISDGIKEELRRIKSQNRKLKQPQLSKMFGISIRSISRILNENGVQY